MSLANPVGPGRIQGPAERWDGTSFRVTSTHANHVRIRNAAIAAGVPPDEAPGLGIDLGNGRCDGTIMAMDDGVVSEILEDPNGSNIIRIKHPHSGSDFSGYAHWSTLIGDLAVGDSVHRGQAIAIVGHSGVADCHLHAGYNRNGQEIDFWPMIEQEEGDMDPNRDIPIATCTVLPGGTLYGDPRRQTVLAEPWPAQDPVAGVGIYALPKNPTTGGKASLAPIRVDMAGGPTEVLRIGWIGRDKVTEINAG